MNTVVARSFLDCFVAMLLAMTRALYTRNDERNFIVDINKILY